MATVTAYDALDMSTFNLYRINIGATGANFWPNLNTTVFGIYYVDILEIDWATSWPYSSYASLFGGQGISFNSLGNVTQGTVTSYAEYRWGGISASPIWSATGFSVRGTALDQAYQTPTTTDDLALIAQALSGNDTIVGSASGDRLQGYAGNDVIYGMGGNDTLEGGDENDTLVGGPGDDSIDGGSGVDTAVLAGPHSAYAVWKNGTSLVAVGPDGRDTFTSVAWFTFADGSFTDDSLLQTSVVESLGGRRLELTNAHYFLRDGTGAGPWLKYGGADFVAGQMGGWAPIAVEANAGGYMIAWKNGAADQFTVWQADSNGNFSGMQLGVVAGSDAALQLLETSFQQDLNGNGALGLAPIAIEVLGATRLAQLGSSFRLWASTDNGPSLKYGGAEFAAGQFGGWTPIAAEANANGYLVAWKNGAADQFTVWQLDANGNYAGVQLGVVAGSDSALQLLETSFQQDLNGSGAIGLVPTTIEALGGTKLVQLGSGFRLWNSGDTGPALKYAGTEFAAGQFGGWTPIATEANASGYLVAWKNGAADQFTVWQLDNNGNFSGVPLGVVAGSDSALQLLETSFQQDLNGSGAIGLVPTTVEALGATKLVQLGSGFRLWNASDSGPALKYGGAEFAAGQFGGWTPIATEANASGYLVAWKNGAADQFTVWQLDNNGNFSGVHLGVVGGSDSALQLLETSFQQDLNGSGAIGLVPTTVEALGATKLVQLGSGFRLWNASDSGPALKYGGAEFVAGQFGAWKPIAAEANAGGYLVAWKNGAADQFTVWQLDAGGNYAGVQQGVVGASDAALQSLETSFQQDSNGSGTIGLVPITIEALGATRLIQIGSFFRLWDTSDYGSSLVYGGAEVAVGQFGAWTPIGAEANASGYLVAWKNGSGDQFTVWQTDSNGNYAGGPIGVVSGSDTGLKQIETLFQQDLNADGILGV